MRRNRIFVIARHEWRVTVMRREFLFATFGLPLIVGLITFVSMGVGAVTAIKAVSSSAGGSKTVAIYDNEHILSRAAYKSPIDGVVYQFAPSITSGQQGVESGAYKAFIAVGDNYLDSGQTVVYRKPSSEMFDFEEVRLYNNGIRAGLVQGKLPSGLVDRVEHPQGDDGPKVLEWNASTHQFGPPSLGGLGSDMPALAVPFGFAYALLISIVMGISYLLHGMIEEKENRLMEILLSSTSHEELLWGKLIGLGGAGLTQLGAWAALGVLPAVTILSISRAMPPIPMLTIAAALVLFVLGFGLYGAIMAGIGCIGTSWRESQQATAVVMLCAIVPLTLTPIIVAQPNGILARLISWFPLTAPATMMVRVATGHVALWDFAIGITSLAAGVWLVQKMSAKLFRLGLLLYGKPPSLPEVWRWLVQA